MTKRRSKLKKPKLEIKFDTEARREYLSGFHKRNIQKKAFYKSKLEKRLVAEKQRIRAEAKKSVGRVSSSHSILPEVERIIGLTQTDLDDELKTKSESFILGSKTVTINSLDDIHMKLPLLDPSHDSDDAAEGDGDGGDEVTPESGNIKSLLKRATNKLLQQSIVFKKSQRFKQKGKKSRGKNKLARSRTNPKGEEPASTVAASKRGRRNFSNVKSSSKRGGKKVKK